MHNFFPLVFFLHPTSVSFLKFAKFTPGKVKWLV